jgi:hypothetical protein
VLTTLIILYIILVIKKFNNQFFNMDALDQKTMLKICNHGTYYTPKRLHYKNKDVSCDRCFRKNIKVYIGWDKYGK